MHRTRRAAWWRTLPTTVILGSSVHLSVAAPIESTPLPTPSHQVEAKRFLAIDPAEAGIDFQHQWSPPAKHRDQLTNAFCGGGVAIGDYDQDGFPDVFLCGQNQGGHLYRNLGSFRFVNESAILVPAPATGTWATGATWADVDNDGWLDLYVCGFDCPNRLYLNREKGETRAFVESAQSLGLDFQGASVIGSFSDYDRDGDLDLFVLTNRLPAPNSLRNEPFSLQKGPDGKPLLPEAFRQYADLIVLPDGSFKRIDAGQYDHLYRNEGPGRPFTEVTAEAGMSGNHYGLSATWWDWNRDGWPDLYVANDFFGPDQLWTSNGPGPDGRITFTDKTPEALPHTPWFSMGADLVDINNDGLMDLFATDMAGSTHYNEKMQMGNMSGPDSEAWFLDFPVPPQYMRNAFYLNTGTPHFMETAQLMGIATTDWTWSVNFGDLDHDGKEDLFVTNGMSRDWLNSDLKNRAPSKEGWDRYYDFWYAQPELRQTNRVFRNQGKLSMKECGAAWGLDAKTVSFGSVLSDLDRDGDLDLVVNNFNEAPLLYQNNGPAGQRLSFRLVGTRSNRFGLGATVTLRLPDAREILTRHLTSTWGFMSSPEPRIHAGLGHHDKVAELTVRWPSGQEQVFRDLAAGSHYTITEPANTPPAATTEASSSGDSPLFTASNHVRGIRHRERPFDDFARQPLLPSKHSQLGPGLAVADVNGDGLEDLYLAQGAGSAGRIFYRLKRPSPSGSAFGVVKTGKPFAQHVKCEDITPLFFDADQDGDQDLYVVSGGVEGEPGDAVFQDRLYLNDGSGRFTHAVDALPDRPDSGGPVTAGDFDRDGDLDLFVGGRVIPGRYPKTPRSLLLRNDGVAPDGARRFADVAAEHGLERVGMVTAAHWQDLNGDRWPELLLATEWGPVLIYHNHEGALTKSVAGPQIGWWSALAIADVDADGDLDLVAGNNGLNSKYKATTDKPELLYFGDFHGTGTSQILEAKFENGICLPHRGYSCSSHAMPSLREKLPTFHAFASKSLEAIYSQPRLENALRLEADTLESGVFLNEGTEGFVFRPLPRLAQTFPVFAIAAGDWTEDDLLDLILVGNSHSPQRETGNMDGGIGLLLEGDGRGGFQPVWPNQSGLVIPGDAKGLALTDLNGDSKPDLLVGINDDELRAFLAR